MIKKIGSLLLVAALSFALVSCAGIEEVTPETVSYVAAEDLSADNIPEHSTWSVKTSAAPTVEELAGLRAALAAVYAADDTKRIELIFSDMDTVGDSLTWSSDDTANLVVSSLTFENVLEFMMCELSNLTALRTLSAPIATTIGAKSFMGCVSLKKVDFPCVAYIDSQAFASCTSLESVSFDAAPAIGSMIFEGCTSLSKVSLSSVTYMQDNNFSGCSALKTLYMPSLVSCSRNPFDGCVALESLTVAVNGTILSSAAIGNSVDGVFPAEMDLSKLVLITGKNNGTTVENIGGVWTWTQGEGETAFSASGFKSIITYTK